MARFSDELVERLKAEVSLVRLVQVKGYEVKPHGKDFAVRCPFHEDSTASLVITPDKNLYHCFGCGAAGSVIDWVMNTEGVSFRHAVELLNADASLAIDTSDTSAKKRNTKQKLPSPLAADADVQTLLRQVVDYYHQSLKQSPEALAYLEKRGLNHPELIDTFKLGFANRTLAYRLPQKNRQAGEEIRTKLQDIGILRDSGHEHLNGSIVVPVMNENGIITEVYGRKINDGLRKGTAMHLYLPGPHQGIFNVAAVKHSKEVILCESLIDAMTFWCAGFRNVTASFGVNGFTDELLQCFISFGVEKVLIAYDRDEAGNAAAEKLSVLLSENGMDVYRVLFPKNMDANEYALNVKPASQSLGLALRKAEWLCNATGKEIQTPLEIPEPEETLIEEPSSSLAADILPSNNEKAAKEENSVESEINGQEIATVLSPDTVAYSPSMDINLVLDGGEYRIRGLDKNLSYEQLKVNILIRSGQLFYIDTFDLYSAKHRNGFVKQASDEIGVNEELIKSDLGKVLLKLEGLQDQLIKGTLSKKDKQPAMSDSEVKQALALLNDKNLLDRILSDFNRCGVVGEETNKLVGYLASCSRKLEKPLAVMVQSSSAAGKSSLMEAVLRFMPEEERIQYSAMTGQSLFYMGEQDLKHKILAIAEEEGASNTSYALKLLQSEGEVSIASTGKNAITGNLETQEYRVEGPVMLFSTTTAIDIDEELMNRCLVLSVDESREQTQAIHAAQRRSRTLEGLRAKAEKQQLINLHQNAQRLLRPLAVMNPYADQLTFLDDKTRTRRDHEKYLGLIDSVTLLHQYQRPLKREHIEMDGQEGKEKKVIEYIEVTLEDIEIANRLAHDVLGRTLDELPPQTRKLLTLVYQWITRHCEKENLQQDDYRFTRKEVREATGWGNTQLRIHLERLMEMEYVLAHRGKRGQSFEYELLYHGEAEDKKRFVMKLIDVETLKNENKNNATIKSSRGNDTGLAGSKRPQNGGKTGSLRDAKNPVSADDIKENDQHSINEARNALQGKNNPSSHSHAQLSLAVL